MKKDKSVKRRIDPKYEKYLIEKKYSSYQMYNFYEKFSYGEVALNDVMNLMQHLYIAEHCSEHAKVLDVCCGRALTVPLLCKRKKKINEYVGLDVSQKNLAEAQKFIDGLNCELDFDCRFILKDITKFDESLQDTFNIVIYTSSIEHMGKEDGIKSLQNVFEYLKEDGVLFLSTPNTPSEMSNQYRCHVHEWYYTDLIDVIIKQGMEITDCIGLIPPDKEVLRREIEEKYGKQTLKFFNAISEKAPIEFWGPVMVLDMPDMAKEVMFVCKKRGKLWDGR